MAKTIDAMIKEYVDTVHTDADADTQKKIFEFARDGAFVLYCHLDQIGTEQGYSDLAKAMRQHDGEFKNFFLKEKRQLLSDALARAAESMTEKLKEFHQKTIEINEWLKREQKLERLKKVFINMGYYVLSDPSFKVEKLEQLCKQGVNLMVRFKGQKDFVETKLGSKVHASALPMSQRFYSRDDAAPYSAEVVEVIEKEIFNLLNRI